MANRLVMAQLNINSLRNKFNLLVQMQRNNLDIMLIPETETDSSFLLLSFHRRLYNLKVR